MESHDMTRVLNIIAIGFALSFMFIGCRHNIKACRDLYKELPPQYTIPADTKEDLRGLNEENRENSLELKYSACNSGIFLVNYVKEDMIKIELEKLCTKDQEKIKKCSVSECEEILDKNWCKDIEKPFLDLMPICNNFYSINASKCVSN
jgi:hypothetical protein